MASKRDSTAQRRARANRAQREALAARSEAASTPRPSRQAPAASGRLGGRAEKADSRDAGPANATADRSDETKPLAGEATTGRNRRAGRARPGGEPVDVATLEGSWLSKVMRVPGGAQVLNAFLVAVLATILGVVFAFLVHTEPAPGTPRNAKNVVFVDTSVESLGVARALIPLLVIVVIPAVALAFSLHPQRRRIWLGAAIVTAVLVVTGAILFIFVAGMLGYAVYRASKVEGPQGPLLRSGTRRAAVDDGPGADQEG